MRTMLRHILVPLFVAATTLLASTAAAQTYSNPANIAIPLVGTANPFPASLLVSGAPLNFSAMTVTLTNFNHTFPNDVAVMLLGPTGASTVLFGRAGSGADAVNATLVFRDGAPPLPTSSNTPIVSGEFAPTRVPTAIFTFASPPGPATPTSAALSSFTGTNPNGIWQLYVQDFSGGDSGSITGGWSITFTPPAPPSSSQNSSFTYQGRLDSGAATVNGTADFRFSLWTSATNPAPAGQAGSTITRSAVPVTNGLFTTSLDFGFGLIDNKSLFLQTEVRSPAGSGAFTTLTPWQELTGALNAQFARNTSQLNNQPASAYLPPVAIAWSIVSLGLNFLNTNNAFVTVAGSSSNVTLSAGTAVINWTTSAGADTSDCFGRMRVRLGTNVGSISQFAILQNSIQTLSGNAIIQIPANGTYTISLEVATIPGSSPFLTSSEISLSGTIINLRQ